MNWAEQLHDDNKNVRLQSALSLSVTQEHLPALLEAWKKETDPYVSENLTWALLRHGEKILPVLLEHLQSTHVALRRRSAHALGKLQHKDSVPALLQALGDPDEGVVAKSIQALGRITDPRALPQLTSMLGDTRKDITDMLLDALEDYGTLATGSLGEKTKDPSPLVRQRANDLLGFTKSTHALFHLEWALEDPNSTVRRSALQGIIRILENHPDKHAGTLALQEAKKTLERYQDNPDPTLALLARRALQKQQRAATTPNP